MNLYPIKKRRGRPPKYLSVWQNNGDNMADAGGNAHAPTNYSTIERPPDGATGLPLELTSSEILKLGRLERPDDLLSGSPPNHLSIPGVEDLSAPPGERECSTSPTLSADLYDQSKTLLPTTLIEPISPVARDSDAIGHRLRAESVVDGDVISPHQVTSGHKRQSKARITRMDLRKLSPQSPPIPSPETYSGVPPDTLVVTPDPVAMPPAKRRPGRPPGSTKKFKVSYAQEYPGTADKEDNYSLRKFFEAGGRDYNEYLDWLKRKGKHTVSVGGGPVTPVEPHVNLAVAAVAAGTGVGTVTQGFPFQALMPSVVTPAFTPRSPVALTPPLLYRPGILPGARGPLSPPPVVMSPPVQPPPAPRVRPPAPPIPAPVIPPTPSDHYPGKQPYPRMTHSMTSPPTTSGAPQPGPPYLIPTLDAQDECALDLSSTRRRMDEDARLSAWQHQLGDSPPALVGLDLAVSPQSVDAQVLYEVGRMRRDGGGGGGGSTNRMTPERVTCCRGVSDESRVESSTEPNMAMWDVNQVSQFVASVPGCQEYGESFREHLIDGATLPHLSEEHLLNFVKMKLGPAIQLLLAVDRLRQRSR